MRNAKYCSYSQLAICVKHLTELLEEKNKKLHEELTVVKEQLNRLTFERDVQEQEKADALAAVAKLEAHQAELEQQLGQLRSEETQLRDLVAKLQALNDGLGHDKVELSKLLVQYEGEKMMLANERQALLQEKSSAL